MDTSTQAARLREMKMDDPDESARALWDLWKMLERLQELLARGDVLAPDPPAPWQDTLPDVRPGDEG